MNKFIPSLCVAIVFIATFHVAPSEVVQVSETAAVETVQHRLSQFFGVPVAHAQLVDAPYQDADGYTVFTPSLDTQIIYVSASEGSDSNDGLSEENPVQTLLHGKSLLRYGYPDWLLLKKGDTWVNESFGSLSDQHNMEDTVHGRSADEPVLISSYGVGDRPLLELRGSISWAFGSLDWGWESNYVAVVGLEFYDAEKDPNHPDYDPNPDGAGISLLDEFNWFLFEDNKLRNVQVVIQGPQNGAAQNAMIRKNLFLDAFKVIGFSSCIFTSHTTNLLLEDNVFDTCGWNADVPGAEATVFDRAAYLCCGDGLTVYRGNIDANGASGGVQLRTGGVVEDSLFLRSPTAISLGSGQNSTDANVPGLIRNNVILDARDINGDGRGFAINMGSHNEHTDQEMGGQAWLEDVEVYNNIISTNERGISNANAISVGGAGRILGLSIRDNIVYDWRDEDLEYDFGTAISFTNHATTSEDIFITDNYFQQPRGGSLVTMYEYHPDSTTFAGNTYWSTTPQQTQYGSSWFALNDDFHNFASWVSATGEVGAVQEEVDFVDTNRSIDTYMTSIGIGGGYDEFMSRAREQSKDTYDERFTAYTVNEYIRDGFALAGGNPDPDPVITFEASDSSILEGESTTLTWSSTNATSCGASGGWSGARATASSLLVSPTATTTYTLTCVGAGGSDVESVVITVTAEPEIEPETPPSSGGGGGGGGGGSRSSGTKFKTNQAVILLGTQIVKDLDRRTDLGTQASSSVGKIVSGTTKRSGGITYYQVSFENRLTGWVPATALVLYKAAVTTIPNVSTNTPLTPVGSPTAGSSTASIMTIDRVNIRIVPGGVVVSQQEAGTLGTLQTLVEPVVKDGYTWVYVNFGPTVGGYVAREFLRSATAVSNTNNAALLMQIQLLTAEVQRLMKILASRQGL